MTVTEAIQAPGDRPGRAALHVRSGWLLASPLVLQVIASKLQDGGVAPPAVPWLLACSYLLLLVAFFRNRHLLGFRILLVGLVLNASAMTANGWRMPVSPETLSAAGRVTDAAAVSSSKSVLVPPENTRLRLLTDVVVIPRPIDRIVSIGDLLVLFGAVVALGQVLAPFWRIRPGPARLHERQKWKN